MLNPIKNMENTSGLESAFKPHKFQPLRRTHHNYPLERRKALRFQEGGELESALDPQDLREPDEDLSPHDQQMREVVVEAMAAIRGRHPDPEKAVQRFLEMFGEKDFQELRQMVLAKERPDGDEEEGEQPPDDEEEEDGQQPEELQAPGQQGMQVGGLLNGPGTGQSDEIEATTPAGRKVLLSDGEYVIDAPTVAALGDGSTSAGARRLDSMRKQIRQQTYGSEKQAKPMKDGGLLVTLKV